MGVAAISITVITGVAFLLIMMGCHYARYSRFSSIYLIYWFGASINIINSYWVRTRQVAWSGWPKEIFGVAVMFKGWLITKVGLTLICLALAIMSCCNYQLFISHGVNSLDSIFMSLVATVILATYALVIVAVAIVAGSIILACVAYFIQ